MGAALDKDPAILAALDWLWSRLGRDAFVLVDHWEPDLCAVGIASPRDHRVLIYISCYDEPPGCFAYELELPPPPGDDFPYQVAGTGAGYRSRSWPSWSPNTSRTPDHDVHWRTVW